MVLREGALVFVANEGPGRVLSVAEDKPQVLLLSSRKVVTPAPRQFRPLLEPRHAEDLLKRLAQPLSRSSDPPAVKEAMTLATSSLDATAMVEAFRGLAATGSVEPEVLTAILLLEAMFGTELGAVLKRPLSRISQLIVREPAEENEAHHSEWFEALRAAGAVPRGGRPQGPLHAIPIQAADAWVTWRRAYEALERLRMYPVIVEERFSWRQPMDGLSRLERALRGELVTRGKFPQAVRFTVDSPMLVVVPYRAPWLAAAWLGFGGVNGCPPPERNARVIRQLHGEWGALPIVFDELSLELVVRMPPRKPAEVERAIATQLAWSEDFQRESPARQERWTRSAHWTVWWD